MWQCSGMFPELQEHRNELEKAYNYKVALSQQTLRERSIGNGYTVQSGVRYNMRYQ